MNQILPTCVLGFLIAIPTNLSTILFVRRRRELHTTTNIFVSNLALLNILVLILMVFEVVFFFFKENYIHLCVTLDIYSHCKNVTCNHFQYVACSGSYVSCKARNICDKKTNKINPAFCRILPSIFMIMGYLRIPFENTIYKTTFIYVVCVTSFILVVTVILSFAVILFVAVNNI